MINVLILKGDIKLKKLANWKWKRFSEQLLWHTVLYSCFKVSKSVLCPVKFPIRWSVLVWWRNLEYMGNNSYLGEVNRQTFQKLEISWAGYKPGWWEALWSVCVVDHSATDVIVSWEKFMQWALKWWSLD